MRINGSFEIQTNPVNTRRYLDVDSMFFERYGRENNVVCLLGSKVWKLWTSVKSKPQSSLSIV